MFYLWPQDSTASISERVAASNKASQAPLGLRNGGYGVRWAHEVCRQPVLVRYSSGAQMKSWCIYGSTDPEKVKSSSHIGGTFLSRAGWNGRHHARS
ncbi:hypothetical protein BC834DRAFT_427125 [Gloeopeniophorella convolvens]|nr:hypothetical protein BC834DRAFT_427125 [Gloeopeniophorella convolvens]